jgi:hypothetical protein
MKPIRRQLKEAFRWKGFDWYRNFTLALIAGLVIPYGVLSATDPARSPFDVKVAAGCLVVGATCILLAANRVFVVSCALMVPAALMYYNALAAGRHGRGRRSALCSVRQGAAGADATDHGKHRRNRKRGRKLHSFHTPPRNQGDGAMKIKEIVAGEPVSRILCAALP